MVTLSSPCRAQDPATCKYHGYEVRASQYVAQGLYDDALRELAARDREGLQPEHLTEFIDNSTPYIQPTPVDKIGVHTSHCCNIHGCKYGDRDCPVKNGTHAQEYACEMCDWNTQTYEGKYGKVKTYYKQVTSIHPEDCVCPTCQTGSSVPENMWRTNARAGDLKNVLWQTTKNNTGKTLTALLEDSPFPHKSATHLQTIIKGDYQEDELDDWGR